MSPDPVAAAVERAVDGARRRGLGHGAVAVACVLRTMCAGDVAAAHEIVVQSLAVDARAVGDVRLVLDIVRTSLEKSLGVPAGVM